MKPVNNTFEKALALIALLLILFVLVMQLVLFSKL